MESIVSVLKQKGQIGGLTPYTYGLSYPGKICFPKQVEAFVDFVAVNQKIEQLRNELNQNTIEAESL